MSRIAAVLFLVALCLGGFGAWGMYTEAGRRRFDEMAGMIPFFAWCGGWVLGIVSGIWILISAARSGS